MSKDNNNQNNQNNQSDKNGQGKQGIKKLYCSFCERHKSEITNGLLIGNKDASAKICMECAKTALDTFKKCSNKYDDSYYMSLTPQKIKEMLDQYIIEQDEAKRKVAVAVYNHLKRGRAERDANITIKKSNLMLIGPTGVGKTFIAEVLSKILKVPFYIADATSITEAGYVGNSVESILWGLLNAADFNLELAQRGIVYIDEIDKLSKKYNGAQPLTRDISGEGVQQALLKVLEGEDVSVPHKGNWRTPFDNEITINTSNILFILGGMFNGIEKIVEERINSSRKKPFGFAATKDDGKDDKDDKDTTNDAHVTAEDLIQFGMIPEFVGRVSVIAELKELSREALRKILTEPKGNLVDQYKALLQIEGIELVFHDDALDLIVDNAVKHDTGARALSCVLEDVMLNILYEAPSYKDVQKCVVTRDYVENYKQNARPIYVAKAIANDKNEKQIQCGSLRG